MTLWWKRTMCLMKCLRPLELTLAILKPDVCRNPQDVQALRQVILDNNFFFVNTKITQLTRSEAEIFYEEHKRKFFFNRLVTFMSSGLISVHIIARENAIEHWRSLMGPTQVFRAQYEAPDSIRAKFGLTDTRNATHGSDSPDAVRREISFFFRDFNVEDWNNKDELFFRRHHVFLDKENWIHRIRVQKAQQACVSPSTQ